MLDADPRVAAIAFAQGESDGSAWPAAMQPSPATSPCVVASFIGFAHLLRRDVFLDLGGYQESFIYYGTRTITVMKDGYLYASVMETPSTEQIETVAAGTQANHALSQRSGARD